MQLVYDYPEALIKAGRPAAGRRAFVEAQLQRFPQNGPLHQIAARPTPRRTSSLKQHQHQGEYYAWQGNLRAAIDQLELASRRATATSTRLGRRDAAARARREQAEQQKEGFGRSG